MKTITAAVENIKASIAETAFDNLYEIQYIKAASHLAFTLAFLSDLSPDEQATLAGKRGAVRA